MYHSLNIFLNGKVKMSVYGVAMAQRSALLRAGLYLILNNKEGENSMNLMELRLRKILKENRADFIDSLRLSGIDVAHGGWNVDAVDKNARAGALSLIQFASQEGISDSSRNSFLQTVAKNLD